MAVKPRRTVKLNYFLLFSTGILVFGTSLWVTLLVIKSVYGRYDLGDILPSVKSIQKVIGDSPPDAAVLFSEYSERTGEPGSDWLRDNVRAWERYLSTIGVRHKVIADADIEHGALDTYRLLVLPGSRALSETEVTAIKKFIDAGGSVFATSGTGSFNEQGEWRGWQFLSDVFGIQFVGEIEPEQKTKIHTLRGGLPITSGIPSGYSLQIATWDRPMACEVLEPRTTQASFWYNFQSDPGLVGLGLEKTAGIVYGSYGKGKFVWMGFELNSVLGDQSDYIYFDRLCRHSVEWLTSRPTVVVKDWPVPYTSAAIIAPTLTREMHNIVPLLSTLDELHMPATFFIDPALATANASLLGQLPARGELGVTVELQSVSGDLAKDAQNSRDIIEKVSGQPVSTILTPRGGFNEDAIMAVVRDGFSSLLKDSVEDRSVPTTIIRGEKSFVSFGKTANTDKDIISGFGLTNPDYQLYTYKEGVDRVMFQGGLYLLRLHTDMQLRPAYVSVMKELLEYIRKKKFWTATVSEVSRWWKIKSALEVSVRVRSNRRISLVISNPSKERIEEVGIVVGLNTEATNVALSSDIIGTTIPYFHLDPKTSSVEIVISSLAGGQSLSYFIDYDNVTL